MRSLWYPRWYRILRVSHFLRVILPAPRITGRWWHHGAHGHQAARPAEG